MLERDELISDEFTWHLTISKSFENFFAKSKRS